MNFFEKELRNIFLNTSYEQHYIGRACYLKVNQDITAKIEFVTHGTYEKYEGIKIQLKNKMEGIIDSITVLFCDLFGKKPHPSFQEGIYPYIWKYNNYEWYAYQPTKQDYTELSDVIHEYIEIYQTQSNGPELMC